MTVPREELDAVRQDREHLVQALQSAGASVNERGQMKCPFHDDNAASGSIHQGKDGVWRFKCFACKWNGEKDSGDVFDVLKARGTDFKSALESFDLQTPAPRPSAPSGGNGRITLPPKSIVKLAGEAAERLRDDDDLLDRLWRERAVTQDIAHRELIGVNEKKSHLTFGVRDDRGQIVAIKHHRIDPETEPKCYWLPTGTDAKRFIPVGLDRQGPRFLCPGELKGYAVASLGLPAIGITGGEGVDLPEELVAALQGREVAIPADDDEAGGKWASRVKATLEAAGIHVRVLDLGFNTADGVNDIGDWLRRELITNGRPAADVRADLLGAYDAVDPWSGFRLGNIWANPATWEPVECIAAGLRKLDEALGGGIRVGGVTLLTGKSGRAKTQSGVQIASNAAQAGIPVGILSLEMRRVDIAHLVAAQLAGVPRAWIAKSGVWGEAQKKLEAALERYRGLPLTILDDDFWDGGLTRARLARIVDEGCRRFGWRLVLLDYLGLLAREPGDASEYVSDLENSTAIKRIAQKYNVALVVIAALRKAAQFKQTKGKPKEDRPVTLDDVLGAGRLVYDAFNVLYVDGMQADNGAGSQPTGIVKVLPLKTRYSGVASSGADLQFRWHPSTGRVCDLEES